MSNELSQAPKLQEIQAQEKPLLSPETPVLSPPSQLPLITANSEASSNKSTTSSPTPEKKPCRFLSTKRSLPKGAAQRLRLHLAEILPLRNVPKDPNRNLVI